MGADGQEEILIDEDHRCSHYQGGLRVALFLRARELESAKSTQINIAQAQDIMLTIVRIILERFVGTYAATAGVARAIR